MKPNEIIDLGNAELAKIFKTHKEFKKIEDNIKLVDDITSVDVETISQVAFSISAYLVTLSGVIAKYTSLANSHYVYGKFSLMWEWNKLGEGYSGKAKDNVALEKTAEIHKDELIKKYVADYLKGKYDSYEKVVSVLQTRLGILRNEMFRA